jgi:hypothetical protein
VTSTAAISRNSQIAKKQKAAKSPLARRQFMGRAAEILSSQSRGFRVKTNNADS